MYVCQLQHGNSADDLLNMSNEEKELAKNSAVDFNSSHLSQILCYDDVSVFNYWLKWVNIVISGFSKLKKDEHYRIFLVRFY